MLKYGQINVTDNFEITYSDLVKNFPGAKLNPKMPTTSFNITIF